MEFKQCGISTFVFVCVSYECLFLSAPSSFVTFVSIATVRFPSSFPHIYSVLFFINKLTNLIQKPEGEIGRCVQKTEEEETKKKREAAEGGQRGRCVTISCSCMHPLLGCFCQSEKHRRSRAEQDAGYQVCGRRRWVRHFFYFIHIC